jgi:hypothetical protein
MSHADRMTDGDSLDPDLLLHRLKAGGSVAPGDLDAVRAELTAPSTRFSRYTLLHIVGRGCGPERSDLVETFLTRQVDPPLVGLALRILCDWWSLADRYVDRMAEIAAGMDWDEDDEARLVGISLLGEYLRGHEDRHLLDLLLHTANREADSDVVRGAAVAALARALGREYAEMPSAARIEPVNSPWSRMIREEARRRLS